MKCYSSNITSSLHTLKLGGILKVWWKLERFGISSASLCLQSDWVMHSSDHRTVTQHAEMEERTIMKASNNYYNLFIIRIKRVYGNIYDGPQNPWNHIVIRLFDGCFVGHEIVYPQWMRNNFWATWSSLAKQWLLKELRRHTILSSEEAEEI